VLRQSGGVLSANDLFEALDGLFVARAFGGLAMADRNADRLLQVALETSRPGEGKSPVRSIPVAMQPGRAAHVVHLVPLRRAAHDIFASADMLVVVSTVSRPAGIQLNTVVTALFDLSPAESRLAMNLARGIPLAEAAQVCGITISSARTYLNRIFQKTGTHRQGELVALLLGAQLLAPLPG
jgi:DNA-binding CsgD family transcriptional regulator